MQAVYSTIGALIVAFVSGLGYLAVKHPKTFRAVGTPVANCAAVAIGGLAVFDAGVTAGMSAVNKFIDPAKISAAYAARDTLHPPAWAYAALVGLSLYVLVLGLMGFRLEAEKEEERRKAERRE